MYVWNFEELHVCLCYEEHEYLLVWLFYIFVSENSPLQQQTVYW